MSKVSISFPKHLVEIQKLPNPFYGLILASQPSPACVCIYVCRKGGGWGCVLTTLSSKAVKWGHKRWSKHIHDMHTLSSFLKYRHILMQTEI